MCKSVTTYYMDCGHGHYRPVACTKASLYEANLSTNSCVSNRSYTSLSSAACETCTLLCDREKLSFQNTDDPLIWMNQVYQASVAVVKPEPRDSAVDDNLDMALAADQRQKVYHKRGGLENGRDSRIYDTTRAVACQVPCDIFHREKKPRAGRGTHGRQASRGNLDRRPAH